MVPATESDGLFWGLTLEKGKLYNQTPRTGFHISMAALAPKENEAKKPVTVFVKYNNAEFALCTLCPGSLYQQTLDLHFNTGEEVTFFLKGNKSTIDLTGYLLPDEFDEDQMSEDGSGGEYPSDELDDDSDEEQTFEELDSEADDDDEEDDEEEEIAVSSSKNSVKEKAVPEKKEIQTNTPKKNKNKKKKKQASKNETLDSSAVSEANDSMEVVDKKDESVGLKRKLDEAEEAENKPKKKKKNKKNKNEMNNKSLDSSVASEAGNTSMSEVDTSMEQSQPGKEKKEKKKPQNQHPKRVLQGGIIMQELKEGHGPVASSGKMVQVYYKGTLKSGKEFDSCLSGKPFKFRLGKQEVIKGWDIGLNGMKVGGKRKLTVPASHAYGKEGVGSIPPNSSLEFDVELKSVN